MNITDNDFIGCHADPPLEHWLPVLEEWLLLFERCYRITSESNSPPWLLMEKTNVAILGSAACRSSWVALSERFISRNPSSNEAADLLLYSPSGIVELVEAKFGINAEPALKNAVKEAVDRDPPNDLKVDRRIGVAFVVPEQTAVYNEESLVKLLENIKTVPHHAIAWYYPFRARNFSYFKNAQKYFSPGITLLVRSA